MTQSRGLVVLDRDGVINVDVGYAHNVNQIEFVPGIFELCLAVQERGLKLAIATNQGGIARGLYTSNEFLILTNWMNDVFLARGISFLTVLHCPHHPDFSEGNFAECECRKPQPGMLKQAQRIANVPAEKCWIIGDKETDMLAGVRAGFGNRIKIGEPAASETKSFKTVLDLNTWFRNVYDA
jgi:D-glycero-D-manno-heptose 1,7-bisphosphate phosphatase